MIENRTPKQIGNDIILCDDGTLWRWNTNLGFSSYISGWEKLPPIPTDEDYEVLQQERMEADRKWIEKQTERGVAKVYD
jgi:hypothetical protein